MRMNNAYGTEFLSSRLQRNANRQEALYDARKELCEKPKTSIYHAGGRIPGYSQIMQTDIDSRKYITLSKIKMFSIQCFLSACNELHVRKWSLNICLRTWSRAYATLLEWINIYMKRWKADRNKKSYREIGLSTMERCALLLCGWLMQPREFRGYCHRIQQDFCLLPEFSQRPLLPSSMIWTRQSYSEIADYTRWNCQPMSDLADSYKCKYYYRSSIAGVRMVKNSAM